MFNQIVSWIVATVGHWGYTGIFALMFLESSFFPFPSEIVIAPAGYLVFKGQMTMAWVIASGIGGSLAGAAFNYWIAMLFGRPFFEKYGKYLLVSRKSFQKGEDFFQKHGHISTFIGRLLPGIRQYISLPAGLSRMNFFQFCLFTSLGAGIWVAVLAFSGYFFGKNQELLTAHIHKITFFLALFCIILSAGYVVIYRMKKKRAIEDDRK